MYTFIVENERGDQLRLTQNPGFVIDSITGLTPPGATINTSSIVGEDGGQFNSSRVDMRNIVLRILPQIPVAENRQTLYRYFGVKKPVKCYYRGPGRNVQIEGYVEAVEGDLFERSQLIQVSILCPQPFWRAIAEIVADISKTISMFEFPFSIDSMGVPFSEYNEYRIAEVINDGDASGELIIELSGESYGTEIRNPAIYNADTGEMFKLNTSLYGPDRVVKIDMENKRVESYQDGVFEGSYFRFIDDASRWLEVQEGLNRFYYTAESGVDNMRVKVRFVPKYKGV